MFFLLCLGINSSDPPHVLAQGCTPRPAVRLAISASGQNRLLGTVTAGAGAVQAILFTGSASITVTVGGQTHSPPFLYVPASPTNQVQFTLAQSQAGVSMMVPLEVTDACGPWRTFAGGGVRTWEPISDPDRNIIFIPGIIFKFNDDRSPQDAAIRGQQTFTSLLNHLAQPANGRSRTYSPAQRNVLFYSYSYTGASGLSLAACPEYATNQRTDYVYYGCDTRTYLRDSAQRLGAQIEAWGTQGKTYDIITHSLGGAVAAYWAATELKPERRAAVRSIITLDSPINGVLDRPTWAVAGVNYFQAAGQVGVEITDSSSAGATTTMRLAIGGLDHGLPIGADIFTASNPNDGVVNFNNAVLSVRTIDSQNYDSCAGSGSAFCVIPVPSNIDPYLGHSDVLLSPYSGLKIDQILTDDQRFAAVWRARHPGSITGVVTRASGGPVAGATLQVQTIVQNHAHVLSAVTDTSGVYTLTGVQSGDHSMTIAAPGFSAPDKLVTVSWNTQLRADVVMTSTSRLVFSTQPSGAQAGVPFSIQPIVAVKDLSNNTVTGFTGAVTLTIKSGTGAAGAVLSETTTVNAVNGVAIFNGLSIDKVGSSYIVTASSPNAISVDSNPFDALAPPPYVLVRKWGSRGPADGQFNYPLGIAVDGSGNVYVGDYLNRRIQKFTNDGQFITKWGAYQTLLPWGVAVDTAGYVYVSDPLVHRIQKFTDTGQLISEWGGQGSGDGQFLDPYGVAVDRAGYVYVVDHSNNRVQKFTSSGQFMTKWGTGGSGDGQFALPVGIAVDGSGNVYVGDTGNARIQKFNSDGQFITKWGAAGSGAGQFLKLVGVAVDSIGSIYVTDTSQDRIQKFTSAGQFVAEWGSQGSADGQFSDPYGVAVDSTGNVFIVDQLNHRIQAFAPGQ
jgi:pimeloyl-ACP methyl ester carboxylesterase